jgi:hypothetical protein
MALWNFTLCFEPSGLPPLSRTCETIKTSLGASSEELPLPTVGIFPRNAIDFLVAVELMERCFGYTFLSGHHSFTTKICLRIMTHNSTGTPTSSHSLKWASKQARVKVKTHATRSIHQQRESLLNTIWKGLNAIRSTWIHILTRANQQPPILFLNLVASKSFRGLFGSKVREQTSNTSLSMSSRSTFMYKKLSVSPIRLFDT